MTSQEQPIFRFGVISDIQYADIDDAMDFAKTEQRSYRETLHRTSRAVTYWNQLDPAPLFIAQLGDLIDGQNSGSYGQGLSFPEPQSKPALGRVMEILDRCHFSIYHSIGNHELYNFTTEELREVFSSEDRKHRVAEENLYYQFRPFPGWVAIMLNPYEVSVTLPKESLGHQRAVALLRQYNDNYLSQGKVDYFRGLSGLNQRFVPFNGGLGERQLSWLSLRIEEAVAAGERILVFSHIPLCPDAASARNIAYDYDRALGILETKGKGNVKAVFAGHYHRGGYAKDKAGIHHVTLKAILTHNDSFGHVDVYTDRLEFVSRGGHGSKNLSFA